MTADIALVMGLLAVTFVLFASGRMRMDVISVLLIIALASAVFVYHLAP